jgi:two-component system phosphate regulon sensor histidine kinase PhoR
MDASGRLFVIVHGSKRLLGKLVLALTGLHFAAALILWQFVSDQVATRPSPWMAAAGFFGAMLILGLTSAWIASLVLSATWRSIDQIIELANALGRGENVAPIDVDRRSETVALALAFQRMQRRQIQRVRRLENEHDRLSTVLDGMEEGVLFLDSERRVRLANAACRRLLQVTADMAVGRPLLEVVRSREIHAAAEEALRHGAAYDAEFEVSSEPRRHLHVRAKRILGDPSPGVVIVLDDVSRLRRLENVRTEFAANVSHELKTPLASIKAYAETLRLGAVNDPDHNLEFVARIEEHADRLHFLIADLLHLARVESGKESFEIVDFPLEELVEECVDYHRESAEAKQITLSIEPAAVQVEVRGDEVAVRTILDNLVNNAIKYTLERGQVVVAWRPDGKFVMFEIRDTGIGIAPDDQQRVFERFYRVDKARSRELGGTGLGLSIVKHTAQALGGHVGLESRLGQGSAFRVWLPRADSAKMT